jgi:transposase-like protein
MNDETRRNKTPSSAERADWVARYRASGMALHRFAQAHGLRPAQLHYWVYQTRPVAPGTAPRFQEVKLGELLAQPPWTVELELPGGPTVRVPASVDPTWVAELIRSVRRVCST